LLRYYSFILIILVSDQLKTKFDCLFVKEFNLIAIKITTICDELQLIILAKLSWTLCDWT